MLGIKDPWVAAPYILCVLSALLCVVWGIMKWNKDDSEEPEEEIQHWAEEENRVESEL
ncbi:symporter small accessory protein [Tichowtungia aerotolerans]|uniref:symporter small accessory protein n=1 Tax=Tichowtungia aerotolerans TaxID=2697043 RepID=UPI001E4B822C|nr:symporter small accessory protein [Tichowtungia aerotolerans]